MYAVWQLFPVVGEDPEVRWLLAALRLPPLRSARYEAARALSADEMYYSVFSFVLAAAVLVAISILLGWHTYLSATAQTTIEFHNNRDARREARRQGRRWGNELDLGPRRNWQHVFDEHDRMWWLRWALPRLRRHRGTGLTWPTQRSEAVQRGARALMSVT